MSRNKRPSALPSDLSRDLRDPSFNVESAQPAIGGAFAARSPPGKMRGVVTDVDAARHAYYVRMSNGDAIWMGRIKSSPGDTSLLEIGSSVRVDLSLGSAYIDGILPLDAEPTNTSAASGSLTGVTGHGGEDPVFSPGASTNARGPNDPTDVLPGDAAFRSSDGASIAALRGPLATIRASALAKMILQGQANHGELVTGTWRHVTWQGVSETTNNGGRTNFRWEGGSDQRNETGPGSRRYTVHLDVGSEGNLVNLRVTNADQQDLFKFHVSAEGRLTMFAAGGIESTGGAGAANGGAQQLHAGNLRTEIQGNNTDQITGNSQREVSGSERCEITQTYSLRTGQDVSLSVGRDLLITVNGGQSEQITDDSSTTYGGDRNVTTYGKTELRNLSDVKMTATGSIEAQTSATAKISAAQSVTFEAPQVKVTSADVMIGLNSIRHAPTWEGLLAVLTNMIQLYDTHYHGIAGPYTQPLAGDPTTLAFMMAPRIPPLFPMVPSPGLRIP